MNFSVNEIMHISLILLKWSTMQRWGESKKVQIIVHMVYGRPLMVCSFAYYLTAESFDKIPIYDPLSGNLKNPFF